MVVIENDKERDKRAGGSGYAEGQLGKGGKLSGKKVISSLLET